MKVRELVAVGVVLAWSLAATSCSPAPTPTTTVTAAPTSSAHAKPSPSAAPGPSAPAPATTKGATAAHAYVFGDEWTTSPITAAQGSGCTPGAGSLPDGVWFGYIKTWSTSQIAFDLACWYSGAGAEAQAAARGTEVTDDYLVVNDNTTIRLVAVAGNIPAKKAAWDDGVFTLSQVIADPGGSLGTGAPYPAWIFVNGGVVTELEVQYVP